MDNCKFCEIHQNRSLKKVYDTILYENHNFFVIPALGCFVKNYIMIVSKKHVNAMCYLSENERRDLLDIINIFRTIMKNIYGFFPIVFEHGASNFDTNKSACCVLHAHVHIVPITLQNKKKMISALELSEIMSMEGLYRKVYDSPYISFMDNFGKIYFRDVKDTSIPSQIMRKWIAKDIGTEKWDWRIYPFEENILTTIDEMKGIIKNTSFKSKNKHIRYVYYCRAMDGIDSEEIKSEYTYVQTKLNEFGQILVNPFESDSHSLLEINKTNAELVINENKKNILQSDCVIVNISKPDHFYVGCIGEMIYAHSKGCYVITIVGETNADKHFYTQYYSDVIVKNMDEVFTILEKGGGFYEK